VTRELFTDGLGFPEGPRWRDGFLWISDIARREVLRLDSGGQIAERLPTPGRPSGLGWLPDGTLLAVVMEERLVLAREGDGWRTHADLSDLSTAPMNDMVVSSAGLAYVTGLGYEDVVEERRPTQIVLVRPDGSIEPQPPLLWRPNGCVITPDETRLIVAEARIHQLTELRIGPDGSLDEPRVLGVLPRGTWADGICLDEAGCVWVSDPKGGACRLVDPDGAIIQEIDTSPVGCIACTLGGDDGRTLFLLQSNIGEWDELAESGKARIETVRVDVPGTGSP
jgi:sugar lactone lactonase YvrE